MAHGERAARKQNKQKDMGSRRPVSNFLGCDRSKYNKKRTHRLERRRVKDLD